MTALGGDTFVLYPDCDDGSQIYTYVNIHRPEHTHTETHTHMKSTLCCFLFCLWPCHAACGILVPQPGTERRSWQGKHHVRTTGPLGNSQHVDFKKKLFYFFKVKASGTLVNI